MNSAQQAVPRASWYDKYSLLLWIVVITIFVTTLRTFVYGLYYVPTGSMEPTILIGERFLADKLSYYFKPIACSDIVIFNDPHYSYSPNPVIAFIQRNFWGPVSWTKRVVGLPGDHVKGMIVDGCPVIYRNGKKITEPYINSLPLIAICDHKELPVRYKSFDHDKPCDEQPFYRLNQEQVEQAYQYLNSLGLSLYKMPFKISYTQTGRNADIFDIYLKEDEYWVMGDNRVASFDSRFWGKSGQALKRSMIYGKLIMRLWSIDSDEMWFLIDCLKAPHSFLKKIRWSRCFQYMY